MVATNSMRAASKILSRIPTTTSAVTVPILLTRRAITTSTSTSFFSSSNSHSTTSPPPPNYAGRPSRTRSLVTTSLLLTAGIFTGFAASLFPRPKAISIIFPNPTPVAPTPLSPEGIAWTSNIEEKLQALAVVKGLREERTADGGLRYKESRPYGRSSPGPHSLSASTLRGPGKFSVAPLVFTNQEQTEGVFLMHLGGGLCGHEGVIHGGLLATVMDEALARTAFLALPNQLGVTATLNVAYKKPTFAEQFVVVRTNLTKVKGRKAWSKGTIETLSGEILVEAEGLFVEPKLAKFIMSSTVREAMG